MGPVRIERSGDAVPHRVKGRLRPRVGYRFVVVTNRFNPQDVRSGRRSGCPYSTAFGLKIWHGFILELVHTIA
jgi:hypothetical protein